MKLAKQSRIIFVYMRFNKKSKKRDNMTDIYTFAPITICIAWVLIYSTEIKAVIGTNNLERIKICAEDAGIVPTKKEWYNCYSAAGMVRSRP